MSLLRRAVPISNFGLASVPWPPSPSQNTVIPALLSHGVVSSLGKLKLLRAVVNGAHTADRELARPPAHNDAGAVRAPDLAHCLRHAARDARPAPSSYDQPKAMLGWH